MLLSLEEDISCKMEYLFKTFCRIIGDYVLDSVALNKNSNDILTNHLI